MSLRLEPIRGVSWYAPCCFIMVCQRNWCLHYGAVVDEKTTDGSIAGGIVHNGKGHVEVEGLGVCGLRPGGGERGGHVE